jgi:cytidylate kinase
VDSAPFVIALDGPAASGKSTVGLGAARQLGLRYFDSGLLYRVLTWFALAREVDLASGEALEALVDELQVDVDDVGQVWRDGANITPMLQTPQVDASVSTVSAHGVVRAALVPVQRGLVRTPGLLLAGRDIGTVILPDARLKIWLNAGVEQRARRRSLQTGEDFEQVLAGMRRRDHLDSSRTVAPMTRAADAVVVDTDDSSVAQVIARIVELARQRGAAQPAERAPGRA